MTLFLTTKAKPQEIAGARIEAKRQAQQRLVQVILSEEHDALAPAIQGRNESRLRDRDCPYGDLGGWDSRIAP